MNRSAPFCSLQGLLHLLYLDCQMGLKISPQRHAGVLGCLPAGENLIIAQQCSLVIRVQDLQCADLESQKKVNLFVVQSFWLPFIQ